MRTLRLLIEYDGTAFSGWQRQGQSNLRTVQGSIEDALAKMTGETIVLRGAGRTDAGVHAEGQVASFAVAASNIPLRGFLLGLNSKLPPDITILDVSVARDDFDARRSARGKVYRYRIWNHAVRSSLHARTAWHVRRPLDLHAMREGARMLVGRHDFRAFRAADCERLTTTRELHRVDVDRQGGLCTVEVEGTAFLKNMVRILVGTLVGVGRGEMTAATIAELLVHGDRTRAGVTAPPQGLTLVRVIY